MGSATTRADGLFEVEVGAGQDFYLVLTGESHAPTSFSGLSGFVDFVAGYGVPWIATDAFLETLSTDFAACPTATSSGGIVYGEVRLYLDGIAAWELPPAADAKISVTGSDGESVVVCFLDDEGGSLESGVSVGATGRFAAFGLPQGPLLVEVKYPEADGSDEVAQYRGLIAESTGENGGVALFSPIYVEGWAD
jgi:hypothetical protein